MWRRDLPVSASKVSPRDRWAAPMSYLVYSLLHSWACPVPGTKTWFLRKHAWIYYQCQLLPFISLEIYQTLYISFAHIVHTCSFRLSFLISCHFCPLSIYGILRSTFIFPYFLWVVLSRLPYLICWDNGQQHGSLVAWFILTATDQPHRVHFPHTCFGREVTRRTTSKARCSALIRDICDLAKACIKYVWILMKSQMFCCSFVHFS